MKIIKIVLGGIIGSFLFGMFFFSSPFSGPREVSGIEASIIFGLEKIITFLSMPISAMFCGGICQGEESMVIILKARIKGFILGMLITWMIITKFKKIRN